MVCVTFLLALGAAVAVQPATSAATVCLGQVGGASFATCYDATVTTAPESGAWLDSRNDTDCSASGSSVCTE